MNDLVPLSSLRPGVTALVAHFVGNLDLVHRLEELGLRRGTMVEMIAPGSPCIVRVDGSNFCLRDAQLFNVLVQPACSS